MDDSESEVKKHEKHQARNSSGSVPTGLCNGKRTGCKPSIPLSAQLYLFENAKR